MVKLSPRTSVTVLYRASSRMNRHGTKNRLIEALDVGPSSAKDPTVGNRKVTWILGVRLVHVDNYGRPTLRLGLGSRRVGGGRIAMGANMRGF